MSLSSPVRNTLGQLVSRGRRCSTSYHAPRKRPVPHHASGTANSQKCPVLPRSGGAERGSNFSETLTVHRPADLPAHGYRTEVTLTLFGGEPGARGTRRASRGVRLVELPRQRARRGRRSRHAAPSLLLAGALARRSPRGLCGVVRAMEGTAPIQSSFRFACFTIEAYRSFCLLRNSAYSSGVLPAGSRPNVRKRSLISGISRILRTSLESRPEISRGIPAGDMKPIQPDIS